MNTMNNINLEDYGFDSFDDEISCQEHIQQENTTDAATNAIEDNYPFIVSEVMDYIIAKKQTNKNIPLLELIADYCIKEQIPIELVGDAIQNDVYFKSLIEKDCEHYSIIKSEKAEMW